MNLTTAMTFDRTNDTTRHRVVYVTRFNERRVINHLTYADALRRADTLRARAYRVTIEPMCAI
jgi:hypothetical protein